MSRILDEQLIRTAELEYFYKAKHSEQKYSRILFNSVVQCVTQIFDDQERLLIISNDGGGTLKYLTVFVLFRTESLLIHLLFLKCSISSRSIQIHEQNRGSSRVLLLPLAPSVRRVALYHKCGDDCKVDVSFIIRSNVWSTIPVPWQT